VHLYVETIGPLTPAAEDFADANVAAEILANDRRYLIPGAGKTDELAVQIYRLPLHHRPVREKSAVLNAPVID